MANISFDEVTKRFPDGTVAVDALTLEIDDGEFIVLVGPSGSGKSTALRMVAGLEQITEGTISIGGRVVNDLTPKERDMAMVFQNYALYPNMSVYGNMELRLEAAKDGQAGARDACRRGRTDARHRRAPCSEARQRSRAASGSGLRWAARSCASRRRS